MAQGNEPGKRDEDLNPEDSSQVVRLPVEGSETENADGIATVSYTHLTLPTSDLV